MIGQTLSHYRILQKLGEGGMGIVYKAEDVVLQRPAAIKVLPHHAVATEDAMARFVREAQAAASLSHPHIATVYEFGEADGESFLAMEYIDGKTLAKLIDAGPLPIEDAVRIASETADGLARAHEKGIIHRDIKPENIMLTREGAAKIMDFGLAEMRGHSRITKAGSTMGTVSYKSPEQARGEKVDERTDVWSLGVVLFEALTGKLPFPGEYEAAVLYLVVHERPQSLKQLRPDVPAKLMLIVEKCLCKNPDERYRNGKELYEELSAFRKALEQGLAQPAPEREEEEAKEKRFEPERRPVTILFSALSTALQGTEETDPEFLTAGLNECFDGLTGIIRRYEGMTDRIVGDKLMAVFGAPVAHENDPERAVRCAHEMMAYINRYNALEITHPSSKLALRIGIHSGVVIAGSVGTEKGAGYSVVGDAINITAGIAEMAEPGHILLSADVQKLVAVLTDVGEQRPIPIRGKMQAINAFEMRSLKAGVEPGRRAAGAGVFVGRAWEMKLFEESIGKVQSKAEVRLLIRGEAGVGKTRLKSELVARVQKTGLSVCEGKCSSFEVNTPYYLWNTFLKSLLRVEMDTPEVEIRSRLHETVRILALDSDEPYLATLLSLRYEEILLEVDEERKRRIFEAARRLLKAYAARRPSVFLFEDLHWVDRFSQDLLEFVLKEEQIGPVLFVCLFRPEYPKADMLGKESVRIDLDRLASDEARQLMQSRLGVEAVPVELAELIEKRSEGNPFFIEEIIKTLLDKGIVGLKKGKLEIQAEKLEAGVPETLQGVILARIDQLEGKIREVLLDASVIGREFSKPVLEQVIQKKTDVMAGLKKLEALELVLEREEARELEYLFKHYLIQEVAYNTLLAQKRKKLHGHIAEAIERLYEDRLKEFYELLAFHYERAENWSKAAEYLSRAGQKATEIYSREESKAFISRKEEAIAKLFESKGEKRLGWIILAVYIAITCIPVAAAMLIMPYWTIIMYAAVPSYLEFELFGSQLLGDIAFHLYVFILFFGYPWAALVLTFFGIIPAFRGHPKLFDILDDQIRVLFRSGKIYSIPFADIERFRFLDRKAKRRWKYKLIDPLKRLYDYENLSWKTWLKEVPGNIFPPFSFGFGSRFGEVHIMRKKGRRQSRLLFPWFNTAAGSKEIALTPSDPRGFHEQLETAYKKWMRKSKILLPVLLLAVLAQGCTKREPSSPPFAEVRAGYEKRVADAKDEFLRDTTNAQNLSRFATATLDKLRFEREVTRRANWQIPQVLTELTARLERAVGRDTTSAELCRLLARTYAERLQRMTFERQWGLTSYHYADWLKRVSDWDRSVSTERLDQTIRYLRRSVETGSGPSDVLYDLVRLMVARERSVESARRKLEKYIHDSPNDGNAWYFLGLTYTDLMLWQTAEMDIQHSALECFAKAKKYSLDDASLLVDLSRQLERYAVRTTAGRHMFEAARGKVPGIAEGIFAAGALVLSSKGETTWSDLLERAVQKNPFCLDALNDLMWLRFDKGAVDQSLSYYARYAEIDSTELLSSPLYRYMFYPSQISFFEKVVENRPGDVRAHANLGLNYNSRERGFFDLVHLTYALRILEGATAANPSLAGPLANMSFILASRGVRQGFASDADVWYQKGESAAERVTQLLKADDPWYQPTLIVQAATYVEIARNHYRNKRFAKAKAMLDKAADLMQQIPVSVQEELRRHISGTLLLIGNEFWKLKEPKKTVAIFERRMELGPQVRGWYLDEATALAKLWKAYRDLGMSEKAGETYKKILRMCVDEEGSVGVSADYALGRVFSDIGEWSTAKGYFERWGDRSFYTLSSLGILAARLGDTAKARSISSDLERMKDRYYSRSYSRACIAAQLGDKEEAVTLLRDYLHNYKYASWYSIRSDMDFEPLWDYPPFQELMRPKD
jgi:class 3 adenylate cyclase/predicted Ser/Thr protein kinase